MADWRLASSGIPEPSGGLRYANPPASYELVLIELRLTLDLVDHDVDDPDGGEHRLALGRLHGRQLPGLFRQTRLGDRKQRIATGPVVVEHSVMGDTREVNRLIGP